MFVALFGDGFALSLGSGRMLSSTSGFIASSIADRLLVNVEPDVIHMFVEESTWLFIGVAARNRPDFPGHIPYRRYRRPTSGSLAIY